MSYKKYLKNLIDCDIIHEHEFNKDNIFCNYCGNLIEDQNYIDENEGEVYCSIKCYRKKIEEEYF